MRGGINNDENKYTNPPNIFATKELQISQD